MNKDKLKEYWEKKGTEEGSQATMKDYHLRDLEIAALRNELKRGDEVLDVGAGNGASGLRLAPEVKKIVLTDFASSMVKEANRAIRRSGTGNAESMVADVLNLSGTLKRKFSVVISTRCLINLTSHKDQCRALDEIKNTLRAKGRLLLLETTIDGWNNLNNLRSKFGLAPIVPHWHNRVFKKNRLIKELEDRFEIVKRINFGEYFVISRVLHPAFVAPQEPRFSNYMNELAVKFWETRMISQLEKYSPLVLYVCRKVN